MVHLLALGQHIVYREGREHPVLYGVFVEGFGIADMVAVAVLLVAIDDDAKHVEDGIAVAVEGAARHGQAAAHLSGDPLVVEGTEGDLAGLADGAHESDVFSEDGSGAHRNRRKMLYLSHIDHLVGGMCLLGVGEGMLGEGEAATHATYLNLVFSFIGEDKCEGCNVSVALDIYVEA